MQPEDQIINLLTHKDVIQLLAEKKKKSRNQQQRVIIETYLECNICGEKLTESMRLKRMNMEYSFLRFLQHLFISGVGAKPFVRRESQCDHSQVSRVFTYDEAMVKFYVSKFRTYSVISTRAHTLEDELRKQEVAKVARQKDELVKKINAACSKMK